MPQNHAIFLFQLMVVLLLSPSIGHSEDKKQSWHGKVVWIPDGDTIYVRRLHTSHGKVTLARRKIAIQLDGIDAPEPKMPFGKKATAFTKQLAFGKVVRIVSKKKDRYGRIIADVYIGQKNLNHALVKAGFAWHYKRYNRSAKLAILQYKAQQKKRGLWQLKKPMAPWIWRHKHNKTKTHRQHKKHAKHAKISGHTTQTNLFHGNSRSKVYHAPTCRYFRCRTCTIPLKDPKDAKKKGFRPHKQCVRKYLKTLSTKKQ